MENFFIFNGSLFSNTLKENIIKDFNGSNLLKEKILDEIKKINFNLIKENKHEYKLSLNLIFNKKEIHIEEIGEDVYLIYKKLLSRLERKIKKESK